MQKAQVPSRKRGKQPAAMVRCLARQRAQRRSRKPDHHMHAVLLQQLGQHVAQGLPKHSLNLNLPPCRSLYALSFLRQGYDSERESQYKYISLKETQPHCADQALDHHCIGRSNRLNMNQISHSTFSQPPFSAQQGSQDVHVSKACHESQWEWRPLPRKIHCV